MRDEDNKAFAACWGLWKPPAPPCLVLATPSCAVDPREPAKASGGYTCQSHPCAWRAHTALADSSPSQRKLGELVMKGINAGTQKEKCYFVVWKIFVSDTACYYQLHFSEIDLPSPGENEVRWWSQLSPVKPQILHNLTQAEAKLSLDLKMLIHYEFATTLCWSKSCRLRWRAEEMSLKGNFISFPEHPR